MENWFWNEYRSGAANSATWPQAVTGVMLLGVRVTAYAVINVAEHRRREAAGVGAVLDPALLDRLLDQPAHGPAGLESPLAIAGVVVRSAAGRELRAVQDASLFAGFTRRWVAAVGDRVPDTALLEAKACGVGILGTGHRVLLAAEQPVAPTRDGWSWLLEEKVYRRWLGERHAGRADAVCADVHPLPEPA